MWVLKEIIWKTYKDSEVDKQHRNSGKHSNSILQLLDEIGFLKNCIQLHWTKIPALLFSIKVNSDLESSSSVSDPQSVKTRT